MLGTVCSVQLFTKDKILVVPKCSQCRQFCHYSTAVWALPVLLDNESLGGENIQRHCYLQLVLQVCISAYICIYGCANPCKTDCDHVCYLRLCDCLHIYLQHSHPFIHRRGLVALLVLYIKYCTCPGLLSLVGIVTRRF